jgi:hypothetical protein
MTRNSTFKVDKWDDCGLNPNPCIYNTISLPIELSSGDCKKNKLIIVFFIHYIINVV